MHGTVTHFDFNDTGPGGRKDPHGKWGKGPLTDAGFSYIYGDEGLPDGQHKGEQLWHMVMVISFKCTEKESQVLLGLDVGDSTCCFTFPAANKTDKKCNLDEYRVCLYFCDYSALFHGNPSEKVVLPGDAWALRITPYGTSHVATWAGIVAKESAKSPEKGRQLLGSLAALPNFPKLGKGASSSTTHPERQRPGLSSDTTTPPEGSLVCLSERIPGKESKVLISSGLLLGDGSGQLWVDNTLYDEVQHTLQPVSSKRQRHS